MKQKLLSLFLMLFLSLNIFAQAPVILQQPVSFMMCEGGTAVLSVSASGNGLAFQWFQNDVPLSGATNPDLTLSPSPPGTYSYYCSVSNESGTVNSELAIVSIMASPVIFQNAASQTVCEGADVQFSIQAAGMNILYQWYFNTDVISGADSNVLNLQNVSQNNWGSYYCVVSGECGPDMVSSPAMLTIMDGQPEYADILSCGAYVLPGLNGFDQYYSGPNGTGAVIAPGTMITQTTTLYVYRAQPCPQEQSFTVIVGPGNFNPSITPDAAAMPMICQGGMVFLYMDGSDDPSTTYQWFRDGVPAEPSQGASPREYIARQPGTYTCTAMNSCGEMATSSTVVTSAGTTINQPSVLDGCIFNGGVASYNLELLIPQITETPVNFEIAFFENEMDAVYFTANDVFTQTGSYIYSNPDAEFIYVRVEDLIGTGCSWVFPVALVANSCESTNNVINGKVRFSPDGFSGCNETSEGLANIQVSANLGNAIFYAYTDVEGNFAFENVLEGMYNIYLPGLSADYDILNPEDFLTVNVQGAGSTYTRNFCVGTVTPATDAVMYFYANGGARPGFDATYSLYVYNSGTAVINGSASLNFDTSKVDFVSATTTTTQDAGTLNFTINNLQPGHYYYVGFDFVVKVPPIVNSGDVLVFDANIDTENLDVHAEDNTVQFNHTVVNSYDPNDILVQQGSQILESQLGEYLNYTIRFQNTGTADAINVRVENELDDLLDWSTFRPVVSSHSFTTTREGNQVVFRFNNIHLPAEVDNEAGSNGYITYKIKAKPTMQIGDVIANQADIYFDFNLPIVTNEVTTQLVSLMNVGENVFGSLNLYPNPASDKVNIQFGKLSDTNIAISLSDLQGKTILNTSATANNNQATLDVSKVQTGMYFIKITSAGQSIVRKLMIK